MKLYLASKIMFWLFCIFYNFDFATKLNGAQVVTSKGVDLSFKKIRESSVTFKLSQVINLAETPGAFTIEYELSKSTLLSRVFISLIIS